MLFSGFGSISSVGRVWRGSTDSPVTPLAAARVRRMISGMSSADVDLDDMLRWLMGVGGGMGDLVPDLDLEEQGSLSIDEVLSGRSKGGSDK